MDTEYQSAKFNYNTIEQKLLGAKVSQGMEEEKKGESFQVVEPAFLPEKPAKPNRLAIMLAGAVLALGLSVGTAAAREFSDKRIHDLEVLQRISRFPVISIIPAIITEADIAARRRRRVSPLGCGHVRRHCHNPCRPLFRNGPGHRLRKAGPTGSKENPVKLGQVRVKDRYAMD